MNVWGRIGTRQNGLYLYDFSGTEAKIYPFKTNVDDYLKKNYQNQKVLNKNYQMNLNLSVYFTLFVDE